jgi:hypothetical protein
MTLGFLGLHPAILIPPSQVRRFAHLQRLQHRRWSFPAFNIASASRSFRTTRSGLCRFRRFVVIEKVSLPKGLETFIADGTKIKSRPPSRWQKKTGNSQSCCPLRYLLSTNPASAVGRWQFQPIRTTHPKPRS